VLRELGEAARPVSIWVHGSKPAVDPGASQVLVGHCASYVLGSSRPPVIAGSCRAATHRTGASDPVYCGEKRPDDSGVRRAERGRRFETLVLGNSPRKYTCIGYFVARQSGGNRAIKASAVRIRILREQE